MNYRITYLIWCLVLPMYAFSAEIPELISLTPEILRPVYQQSDYFEDVHDLDGAALFYAPGDGELISDLRGARVAVVAPYNTVMHEELYQEELKCVWGSLDVYSCSKFVDNFWDRPSNVFYSLSHVANVEGKLPCDVFENWSATHSKTPSKRSAALNKGKDFCSCPWYRMLDVKISSSSGMFSSWLKRWQDKDKGEDMSNWRKRWSVSDSFSSSRKGKPYALMWGLYMS